MILSDELKLIDYVYKESPHKPFAINTITNPLFINTTWSYLFNWYGKSKYGRMPVWFGLNQNGFFGSKIKFSSRKLGVGDIIYLIIEPTPGIPEEYIKGYLRFENTRSIPLATKRIGNFTVQKRQLKLEKPFSLNELVTFTKQR